MEKKLTKEEVRTPDQLTLSLGKFAEWVSKNVTLVVGLIIGLVILGGAISVVDYFKTKKENDLQGEMARFERQYTDKKTKFKEATQAAAVKAPAPKKGEKKAAKEVPPAPVAAKASGDLDKDYGPEVSGFQELVTKSPTSKAGQMSAIYLAEIYSEYRQPEKAIETLNKAVPQNDPSDVLSALALNLKAGLLTDQGQCPQAVDIWQKIINQKKLTYMHDESKLRSAVCYEKMDQLAKAEQYYLELSKDTAAKEDSADKAVSEDAKKYLRLLKLRTGGGI